MKKHNERSLQLINGVLRATLVLALAACGADAESSGRAGAASDQNGGPAAGEGGTGGGDGGEPFIPEEEIEVNLQAPQGGERYVFVVSTGLDAVVRIDGITLHVDLIEVGGEPTVMRTLGAEDALLVINEGTRDFSVVRMPDPDADPMVTTLDSPSQVNRLEVAEDGQWAVAWYDPDQPGAVGDLQQVLVLSLGAGAEAVYPVSVGFHPVSVTFQEGGTDAFVVTEDGVSVIEMASLTGPDFVPSIVVTPDPFELWFDREVLITPDGVSAVVRRGGVAELRIVDLASGEPQVVVFPGSPTDVDLTPDASEALVVLRDEALLLRVPLDDPEGFETIDLSGTPAGLATLTPDGGSAVLYSTLDGAEWIAVLDLASGEVAQHKLQKSVSAVAPAPDGKTVLVLHKAAEPVEGEAPPTDLSGQIDASQGYSVLDVETGFTKLVLLDQAPLAAALTPDGAHAYVMVPSGLGTGHFVDDVDLRSMLVTEVPLGSAPTHAVYIPAAERVAVNQDHPVGRITFIKKETGATVTVTGFELNGLIE